MRLIREMRRYATILTEILVEVQKLKARSQAAAKYRQDFRVPWKSFIWREFYLAGVLFGEFGILGKQAHTNLPFCRVNWAN